MPGSQGDGDAVRLRLVAGGRAPATQHRSLPARPPVGRRLRRSDDVIQVYQPPGRADPRLLAVRDPRRRTVPCWTQEPGPHLRPGAAGTELPGYRDRRQVREGSGRDYLQLGREPCPGLVCSRQLQQDRGTVQFERNQAVHPWRSFRGSYAGRPYLFT